MAGQRDSFIVAEVRALSECTDSGGDWLVARDNAGDVFFGGHACRFVPAWVSSRAEASFAVLRYTNLDVLIEPTANACVTTEQGQRLSSSRQVEAVALFVTEGDAREAVARWQR